MALGTPVIGAASTFTAGGTTLTVPYATQSGPGFWVLVLGAHPDTMTATTPTGWTGAANIAGGSGAFGLNTGPVRAAGFVKNADGETGNLSVTVSAATNSAVWGRIVFVPSGGGPMGVAGVGGTDTTTGTAWSVTFGSNPGILAGDVCITALAIPTATLPTFASSALAATGATFTGTLLANTTAAVGNSGGGRVESWTVTGTASAAAVHTITLSGTTTNDAGGEVLIRLRELPRVSGVPGRPARRPPVSVRRAQAAAGSTDQAAIPAQPGRIAPRRAQVVVRRAQPVRPVPPQTVVAPPPYVPSPARRGLKGWPVGRRRAAETAPPQVAAPPVASRRSRLAPARRRTKVEPVPAQTPVAPATVRRGVKGWPPRRRTRLEVVPPQIVVAPPTHVPRSNRRGFKGWQPRRRTRVEVVPPQMAATTPSPYVPAIGRRGFKGLQPRRRTKAEVTPAQQAAPVAPKYVPQPPRRGLKGVAAPRHRTATVTPPQVTPTAPRYLPQPPAKHTLRAMPRRGRHVTSAHTPTPVHRGQPRRPVRSLPRRIIRAVANLLEIPTTQPPVTVLGFAEAQRPVTYTETQRAVTYTETQQPVAYAEAQRPVTYTPVQLSVTFDQEAPVHLSKTGIERYQPNPSTTPTVAASVWEASFDGGTTWVAAQVVSGAPTWLVAGPDATSPGSATVLPDTAWVVPALRFANAPEVIVRDATFDEGQRPPTIHLTD